MRLKISGEKEKCHVTVWKIHMGDFGPFFVGTFVSQIYGMKCYSP